MIDVYKLAQVICDQYFRPLVPKDSGNMAYNATKIKKISETEVIIYIDPGNADSKKKEEGVAPYVPYTNEPWISPKWRGKQNPNEKWFQRAAEKIAYSICFLLDGTIQREGEE